VRPEHGDTARRAADERDAVASAQRQVAAGEDAVRPNARLPFTALLTKYLDDARAVCASSVRPALPGMFPLSRSVPT